MKTFNNLKDGDRIQNKHTDLILEAMFYDFYGNGKIICLTDDKSIWPASEFNADDWYQLGTYSGQ